MMKPPRIKFVSSINPEAMHGIGSRLNTHSQNLSKNGFTQQNFICKWV